MVSEQFDSGNRGHVEYVDIPDFSGGDPSSWLVSVSWYFLVNKVPEEEKIATVAVCFEGEAAFWFRWQHFHEPFLSWLDFKDALRKRFGSKGEASEKESMAYQQWSVTGDYQIIISGPKTNRETSVEQSKNEKAHVQLLEKETMEEDEVYKQTQPFEHERKVCNSTLHDVASTISMVSDARVIDWKRILVRDDGGSREVFLYCSETNLLAIARKQENESKGKKLLNSVRSDMAANGLRVLEPIDWASLILLLVFGRKCLILGFNENKQPKGPPNVKPKTYKSKHDLKLFLISTFSQQANRSAYSSLSFEHLLQLWRRCPAKPPWTTMTMDFFSYYFFEPNLGDFNILLKKKKVKKRMVLDIDRVKVSESSFILDEMRNSFGKKKRKMNYGNESEAAKVQNFLAKTLCYLRMSIGKYFIQKPPNYNFLFSAASNLCILRPVIKAFKPKGIDLLCWIQASSTKIRALEKLQLEIATSINLIGVDTRSTSFFLRGKAPLKNLFGVFALGDQVNMLEEIDEFEARSKKYPYEVLFRSLHKQPAASEYLFCDEFFGEQSMFHGILHHLIISWPDSYLDQINISLLLRIGMVFDMHFNCLRNANVPTLWVDDEHPHYVMRCYAEFLVLLIWMSDDYGDGQLELNLERLQMARDDLLVKLAKLFQKPKLHTLFPINYDITVLMEAGPKGGMPMRRKKFNRLQNLRIAWRKEKDVF